MFKITYVIITTCNTVETWTCILLRGSCLTVDRAMAVCKMTQKKPGNSPLNLTSEAEEIIIVLSVIMIC